MDFVAAAIDHKTQLTKQNVKIVFDLLDANGDGAIDVEDLKAAFPTDEEYQQSFEPQKESSIIKEDD